MTRLIDADEFKSVFTKKSTEAVCGAELCKAIISRIDDQPTVDAVPVIRCYECKHFREFEKWFSNDWDGSCKYWNTHSTVYSNFCGCAERKEE